MLQLFEHEARHHQHARDEAGLADVGDAAVDDRAGVHQDAVGLPRGLAPRKPVAQAGVVLARMVVAVLALVVVTLLARRPPRRPPGSRRGGEEPPEVVFAQHGDGDAYIGEQDRGERRQPVAEPKEGDLREEDRGQRGDDEADDEADDGGDDVADLSAANLIAHPPIGYQRDPDGENQRHQCAEHGNARGGRCTQVDVGRVQKIEEYRQSDADGDDQPDDAADELPSHTVLRSDPPWACRMWRVHPAHAHVRAAEDSSDYHGCATYMTRISAVGQPAQSHHRRGKKRPRARYLHRAEATALPLPSRPDDPASPANAPLHQHLRVYLTDRIRHYTPLLWRPGRPTPTPTRAPRLMCYPAQAGSQDQKYYHLD